MRVVLRMSCSGSASSKTRSADLPASTVPSEAASPTNSAGPVVARPQRLHRAKSRIHQIAQFFVQASARHRTLRLQIAALIRARQNFHSIGADQSREIPITGSDLLPLFRREITERPGRRIEPGAVFRFSSAFWGSVRNGGIYR